MKVQSRTMAKWRNSTGDSAIH